MLATQNFRAFVTTLQLSPTKIHQLYNQRGDCENKIKELKYDFSIDGFALKSFAAMEAAFRLVMVAYYIMSLFKQKAMEVSGSKRLYRRRM
jgi:IS4 transposase